MKSRRYVVEQSIDTRVSGPIHVRLILRVPKNARVTHNLLDVQFSASGTFGGPRYQWAVLADGDSAVTVEADQGELRLEWQDLVKLGDHGWAVLREFGCVPTVWNGVLATAEEEAVMPEADQAVVLQQLREDRRSRMLNIRKCPRGRRRGPQPTLQKIQRDGRRASVK